MGTQKIFPRSLEFWVISSILVLTFLYIFVSEMVPSDLFISSKPYRTEDYFSYQSHKRKAYVSRAYCHFHTEKFIEDPENLFDQIDYLFRDVKGEKKVCLVEIENRHYVATKYKCRNFWAWIKQNPFKSSKALRSWHFSNRLIAIGVPTPRPIFMIEKRIGPFSTMSYCVHEYIEAERAADYFALHSPYKESWPKALENLKDTFERLNEHKLIHSKISLTNTLFVGTRPYLLDTECMHQFTKRHTLFEKRVENCHTKRLEYKLAQLNPDLSPLCEKTLFPPVEEMR